MKFYGTYIGFEKLDICEFDTKEELDAWLRGEDRFAREFGIMFPRKEFKNKSRLKAMINNKDFIRTSDMDGITWLLFRPTETIA